jgi:hypothetical protein
VYVVVEIELGTRWAMQIAEEMAEGNSDSSEEWYSSSEEDNYRRRRVTFSKRQLPLQVW